MSSNTESDDIRELFSRLVKELSRRFLADANFRFSMYSNVDATLAQAGKTHLDDWIQNPRPIDPNENEEPVADPDALRDAFSKLVRGLSNRLSSDPDFRSRVQANAEEALACEGKDRVDDWIQRAKKVDPRAIEDGIQKGELNPSC